MALSPEIFESQVMKELLVYLERAAQSSVPVLFLGPSGSGKEVLATRLHRLSSRRNHPFVAVNCGALHGELLLSELFGHVEGAFTGAYYKKRGLVEEAHMGTLFLDEIGELPLPIQAQILRFLQSGEYYRVGSHEVQRVDVRIIAATNRNLEKAVQNGQFREDLFYRLSTVTFHVPSLLERSEDLEALIRYFFQEKSVGGKEIKDVDPRVMEALMDYHWPGNIRQLKNTIERSKILSAGTSVRFEDLPTEIRKPTSKDNSFAMPPPTIPLHELEKRHIFQCLAYCHGNKTQAAKILGITVKTLYNKLERYELAEKSQLQSLN